LRSERNVLPLDDSPLRLRRYARNDGLVGVFYLFIPDYSKIPAKRKIYP